MRALLLLAALVPGAAPAAAQPAPADPVPLRPASVGVGLERDGGALRVARVLPGSPAAAAGVAPGDTLAAVDGRPAAAWSTWEAQTALAGPAGAPVTLALRTRAGARTVRLARADVLTPSGLTGVVTTERFVVHHKPGEARVALAVARASERLYARSGLPRETGGRRAHLYLAGDPREPPPLPLWAAWAFGEVALYGAPDRSAGYLAYGDPGRAAEERLSPRRMTLVDAREAHRRAAGLRPSPRSLSLDLSRAELEAISLREHVRERHGPGALRTLWRSDLPWERAVPRALGVSAAELEREWRHAITHLGPDPRAGVAGKTARAALGWGALFLLLGVVTARRREVA